MKPLKDMLTEGSAFVNSKKAETIKNIETVFNNIKDPKEAMEFIYDMFEAFQTAINSKAKYTSSANPNVEAWKKIDNELDKNFDSYLSDIEEIEKRLF